jgi:predicted Zn-dependent peptidase
VENYFDDKNWVGEAASDVERIVTPSVQFKRDVKMPHSVQSSIRIGKRLFNKTHKDFQKMQVLNTLLGGYFGSRLMTNIREEKGFTYGIHSGLSSLIHDGYFIVSLIRKNIGRIGWSIQACRLLSRPDHLRSGY